MTDFYWNNEEFSDQEQKLLAVIAEYYPVHLSQNGIRKIVLKKTQKPILRTTLERNSAIIEANTLSAFSRGLGSIFAGVERDETVSFDSLGIMFDCSRNKVFTVEYLKRFSAVP